MRSLVEDTRYALRQLRRAPGFTLTALLTLALGIGAVVAVFSIVEVVLLRPYDHRQPGKLVVWRETIAEAHATLPVAPDNYKHYLELKARAHTVADAAIVQNTDMTVTPASNDGHPELLHALRASPNLLSVLGVTPALGRAFLPAESEPGRDAEVILAWPLWQQLFHGDPRAIGRTVRLGGQPRVVVGILPETFRLPPLSEIPGAVESGSTERYQILLPLVPSESDRTADTAEFNFVVLARLHPGVTLAQAQTELDGLEKSNAAVNHVPLHLGVVVTSLAEEVTSGVSRALWLLLATTGGVLLIACVNLANLQLARSIAREREVAMRAALGAGRLRLMQAAWAESLILATGGALLGVLFALAAVRLARIAAPASLPRLNELAVSPPALLAAVALAAGTALLFGLLPALATLKVDPQRTLQSALSGSSAALRAAKLRRLLVAAEVALSVLLLALSGVAAQSFRRVLAENRHFAADHVLLAQSLLFAPQYDGDDPASSGAKRRTAFLDQAITKLQAIPGVTAAGITNTMPLSGDSSINGIGRPDHPLPEGQHPLANQRVVSPGYFSAMGIPFVAGHTFDPHESTRPLTAVISATTARAAWPEADPLGRTLTQHDETFTVVGITADARINDLKRDAAIFYLPYWSLPPNRPVFIVRGTASPEALAAAVRRVLWQIDPDVAIPVLRPLTAQVSESVATERFEASLFTAFGAAALLLSALGLYGVLAYTVSLRMREFGVRMALGSPRAALARLVLREASLQLGAGLLIGLALTLLAARAAGSLFYQTSAADPVALTTSVLLLLAAATLASIHPARRAAHADPMRLLREN